MDEGNEYLLELREVRRHKDTERSKSSKCREFESDLLRYTETRKVAGPTESRAFDESAYRQRIRDEVAAEARIQKRDLTPGQQALLEATIDIGVEVTTAVVREFVMPLVRDVALPTAKAKLGEIAKRRRTKAIERVEAKARAREAKAIEFEEIRPEENGHQDEGGSGDVEVAEPSIPLSRSEFLKTQLELKLAEDYAERKRWILAHADVTDEDVTPQLKQSVALILEGKIDELDEDARVKVATFLHHSVTPSLQERAIPLQPGLSPTDGL